MAVTLSKQVRPNAKLQEMYINIEQGQRVIIQTEGLWSPDLRNTIDWCGANGFADRIGDSKYLMEGVNVGALVGKIGDYGPFAVGAYYDFKSSASGPLYLAMNEDPERHDQAGLITIHVVLFDME